MHLVTATASARPQAGTAEFAGTALVYASASAPVGEKQRRATGESALHCTASWAGPALKLTAEPEQCTKRLPSGAYSKAVPDGPVCSSLPTSGGPDRMLSCSEDKAAISWGGASDAISLAQTYVCGQRMSDMRQHAAHSEHERSCTTRCNGSHFCISGFNASRDFDQIDSGLETVVTGCVDTISIVLLGFAANLLTRDLACDVAVSICREHIGLLV